MTHGRPTKKPRIIKYESKCDEVQFHRHHIYCTHEHGNISVQSSFIEDKMTVENVQQTLTDPTTENWPEESLSNEFDLSTKPTIDEDEDDMDDTRKKKIPSVST